MAERGRLTPFTTRQEMQRLAEDGERKAKIARELKVSRPTVYKYLREKSER